MICSITNGDAGRMSIEFLRRLIRLAKFSHPVSAGAPPAERRRMLQAVERLPYNLWVAPAVT